MSGSSLRVALLSDTHGSLDVRIASCVADCDYAVHAGDIGNASILAALQPKVAPVAAVRGNNDIPAKWPRAEHALLKALPETLQLELPGGILAVVHGHRAGAVRDRHARLRNQFPNARAIVYGHSHRLVCDQAESIWVLNPGAAGHARTYGGPSCLILHAGARRWRVEILRYTNA
ncbi:MAG: metallophosphatase family protein [Gammaproteobacteria bacterium]|nr:metallophosphatase family protein [Gammaproteobacteria bacterium]